MLVEKLHLKPGMRFAVANSPGGFTQMLGKLPAGVTQDRSLSRALDLALLFVLNQKELKTQWSKATASVKADGAVSVAYPKKSSGVDSDLTMGGEWEVYKDSPWQPGETSGRDRPRRCGTVCIDRINRVITAPTDLRRLLDKNVKAATLFETLSFTNQREYVSWIIEAKRPETRTARLTKTVEGLSKGKKNPTDK